MKKLQNNPDSKKKREGVPKISTDLLYALSTKKQRFSSPIDADTDQLKDFSFEYLSDQPSSLPSPARTKEVPLSLPSSSSSADSTMISLLQPRGKSETTLFASDQKDRSDFVNVPTMLKNLTNCKLKVLVRVNVNNKSDRDNTNLKPKRVVHDIVDPKILLKVNESMSTSNPAFFKTCTSTKSNSNPVEVVKIVDNSNSALFKVPTSTGNKDHSAKDKLKMKKLQNNPDSKKKRKRVPKICTEFLYASSTKKQRFSSPIDADTSGHDQLKDFSFEYFSDQHRSLPSPARTKEVPLSLLSSSSSDDSKMISLLQPRGKSETTLFSSTQKDKSVFANVPTTLKNMKNRKLKLLVRHFNVNNKSDRDKLETLQRFNNTNLKPARIVHDTVDPKIIQKVNESKITLNPAFLKTCTYSTLMKVFKIVHNSKSALFKVQKNTRNKDHSAKVNNGIANPLKTVVGSKLSTKDTRMNFETLSHISYTLPQSSVFEAVPTRDTCTSPCTIRLPVRGRKTHKQSLSTNTARNTGQRKQPSKKSSVLRKETYKLKPAGTGNQDPTGTGNLDPTGTGHQDPSGTGNQDPTGTGNQDPAGTGNPDSLFTLNSRKETCKYKLIRPKGSGNQNPTVSTPNSRKDRFLYELRSTDNQGPTGLYKLRPAETGNQNATVTTPNSPSSNKCLFKYLGATDKGTLLLQSIPGQKQESPSPVKRSLRLKNTTTGTVISKGQKVTRVKKAEESKQARSQRKRQVNVDTPEGLIESGRMEALMEIIASQRVKITSLQNKTKALRRVNKVNQHFGVELIQDNDSKIRFYTGFPSYKKFKALFDKILEPKVSKLSMNNKARKDTWVTKYTKKPGPKRRICLLDEFLLTMMKLRLNLAEEDLAYRFGLHQTTVSRTISQWLPVLSSLNNLIQMPNKEQVPHSIKEVTKGVNCVRLTINPKELDKLLTGQPCLSHQGMLEQENHHKDHLGHQQQQQHGDGHFVESLELGHEQQQNEDSFAESHLVAQQQQHSEESVAESHELEQEQQHDEDSFAESHQVAHKQQQQHREDSFAESHRLEPVGEAIFT